jgi:hypothetical protein
MEFAGGFIKTYIRPGMSAIEKEIIIHDYIVNNTDYFIYSGTTTNDIYSEYGVFYNNEAVCQGYAEAAKLLLNLAGIYSINVVGTGSGQSHAWNIVKLYGDCYHMDVTWDDPITTDGTDILRYDYFNITQQEVLKDHALDSTMTYPAAYGTRYNYFAYTGTLFSTRDQVIGYIKDMVAEGTDSFSFKISNYSAAVYGISDLIRQAMLDLGITSYSAVFSVNSSLGVVSIEIN